MQTLKHNFSFPGQLSQSLFPDVFLTTKDAASTDFIPAHRVLLAAVSDKLHGMCKEGGKVFIRNISYKVLEQVLRFIYKGRIEMESNEDIENLRDGLDMLKVNIVMNVTGAMNENEVLDVTNDNYLQDGLVGGIDGDRDLNETVSNACVTNSEILDNECLVKTPNLDDEQSFGLNHNSVGSQVKIKTESFFEVLDSMSYIVENQPTQGNETMSRTTSTPIVEEEMICDQTCDSVDHESIEIDDEEKLDRPKKFVKSQTKVPCAFCDEHVTLQTYVNHCKKNHSISNDDEGNCKKKCLQCGAKVHIIAKKFHDAIYHPEVVATDRNLVSKTRSLEINEHNKTLTKIECDFCNASLVYRYYKEHVKRYHPEINYKEQVKCGKCSMRVFKVAFKYHREIFHKSAKVTSHPVRNVDARPIMKLKLPKAFMKDVKFKSESPDNTISVEDTPSQPSEFQLDPVHVSDDGSTDNMKIDTEEFDL